MVKKNIFILVYLVLTIGYAYAAATIPQPSSLTLNSIKLIEKDDRILILAPHPDDEAIGCAGIIQEAVDKGADIRIVYLTNGDHNQVAFIVYEKRLTFRKGEFIHMGEVRKKEAIKAMKLLGVDEKKLIFLGYPDFGTFTIFKDFWQSARPFKSMLTRISQVPYKENFSFGAPYKGESILTDIKKILRDYKPNKIFVSHPADTNVDHKALYLFLRIALCDLAMEIPYSEIYPYLVHCLGWPLPRHYHPQLDLNPPRQFLGSQVEWLKFDLTPQRLEKKHQAILCYRSQTSSSAFYLLAFARKNELFGDYPDVELKKEESPLQQAISFFGFSNMFADSGPATTFESAKQLTENKGQVSYGISEDNLLIRIDKPRELNKKFHLQLYLFGYSAKTPFAFMPKVRIITKYKKFKVFDARKMIATQGINLEFNHKEVVLKVPLKILGDPDFILAAVKSYTGSMHVDTTSFRAIIIE